MSDFEPRMIKFRIMGAAIFFVALGMVVITFIGTLAAGVTKEIWAIALVLSLLGALVGAGIYGIIRLLISIESNTFHADETLVRMLRHIDDLKEGIHAVNESILLSEEAKAIAFRDKDLQTLRQAVEEEIKTKDWESAMYLADQMEKRFGVRQEAEQFRQRVAKERDEISQRELGMVVAKFEDHLKNCEWAGAEDMIKTIQKQFADIAEVKQLQEKYEQAKLARKKELIQAWDRAIQEEDAERKVEILKELDGYLSPNEAAAFEESAREAFRTKLHNMGVQFSLLVTEKIWDRALEMGTTLIKEFPNSRMAQEIRDRLPNLQARAKTMQNTEEKEVQRTV
jgi:prepilin signal peptidase PulO-like enzyme (type II secretory pathway)